MRIRKQPLGDRNIVGAKVEQSRKAIGMKQKGSVDPASGAWH